MYRSRTWLTPCMDVSSASSMRMVMVLPAAVVRTNSRMDHLLSRGVRSVHLDVAQKTSPGLREIRGLRPAALRGRVPTVEEGVGNTEPAGSELQPRLKLVQAPLSGNSRAVPGTAHCGIGWKRATPRSLRRAEPDKAKAGMTATRPQSSFLSVRRQDALGWVPEGGTDLMLCFSQAEPGHRKSYQPTLVSQ